MGTRGVYGFRIDGQDKVTYNHFDSYPSDLGASVMLYISQTPLAKMKEVATHIDLVDRNSAPPERLKRRYRNYADLRVSDQSTNDWYCLLRKVQGDLFPYNEDLRHMIDNHEFLYDSLFCEWAYIINLDSSHLETYIGFNRDPVAAGRYASGALEQNSGYFGVVLANEMSLESISEANSNIHVRRLESLVQSSRPKET